MKRTDYINWDEYFMGIALLTAMRSKDPNSQVGACIVSSENKILSLGYNGMPIGCSDDEMPWEREGAPLDTKAYGQRSKCADLLNCYTFSKLKSYACFFFAASTNFSISRITSSKSNSEVSSKMASSACLRGDNSRCISR